MPAGGLWLAPTFEGMVALDGLLEPEAGQTLLAALEPLARPSDARDARSGSQRQADALTELARRHLEGGRLPQTGGVRPQLTVTVDLDSLLGHPGTVGGEVGWAGPLDPQACRRLAGVGAVTRVLVSRQPPSHHPGHDPSTDQGPATPAPSDVQGLDPPPAASDPNAQPPPQAHHRSGTDRLAARLQAATALLPRILGGAPTQPLEVGRTTRVVQPAQRAALAVRDGAVSSPTVNGPWPGATPTICGTGSTAAPPTWPTWPCYAEPTTEPSMRAAGGYNEIPTAG